MKLSWGHPMGLFRVPVPSILMPSLSAGLAGSSELWLQVVAIMQELVVDALWATLRVAKLVLQCFLYHYIHCCCLPPYYICWTISKLQKATLS